MDTLLETEAKVNSSIVAVGRGVFLTATENHKYFTRKYKTQGAPKSKTVLFFETRPHVDQDVLKLDMELKATLNF